MTSDTFAWRDGVRVAARHRAAAGGARGLLGVVRGRAALDWRAIGTVDALVFINMAPLYERTLGDYLYYLGRWLLEVTHRAATLRRARGGVQWNTFDRITRNVIAASDSAVHT